MTERIKLCFVVSEDWYFCSHRLPLAVEAIRRGWEVVLVARMSIHQAELNAMGIRTVNVDIDRGGVNPVNEFRYWSRLVKAYRQERPDIIHHVAMKPCLYGSMAARFCGLKNTVNAIAGLGTIFTSPSPKIRRVRPFVKFAFNRLLGRPTSRVIMQNTDDVYEFETGVGIDREHIHLIRGSGVDMDEFYPPAISRNSDVPMIVLVSRLLIEKGVLELIEAGRILKERKMDCRVVLVGDSDPHNPHAVSEEELAMAESRGWVELWGRRNDIADIYREADIATLPSYYREGIPKTLLEAAASGLPIVTTDSVGCRETVDEGRNGFRVPVRDAEALADALAKLISDTELRNRMGQKSRLKAMAEFDVRHVVDETFKIYSEILSSNDD